MTRRLASRLAPSTTGFANSSASKRMRSASALAVSRIRTASFPASFTNLAASDSASLSVCSNWAPMCA